MRGIFYSFGYLGQLLMSQVSIHIVNAGFGISSPVTVAATLDAFMVFFSFMMGAIGIFDEDEFVGVKLS